MEKQKQSTAAQHAHARGLRIDLGARRLWRKASAAATWAPTRFLAGRSWLACAFLLGLLAVRRTAQHRRGQRLPWWIHGKTLAVGGVLCGTALFAASAAQQMGIGTTSTAKAGFHDGAVRCAGAGVRRAAGQTAPAPNCGRAWRPGVVGLYLLCLAGRDTLALTGGEWQLLVCAFLFTLQILLVNRFSPRLDGIQLSFVQFLTVSVLSTVCMFVFEQPTAAQFRDAAVSVLYCGIMSSGVAYTLQIVGQKALDPTIASLAMCLESVFSALAGWVILGQTLSAPELAGLRADVRGHRGQPTAGYTACRIAARMTEQKGEGPLCRTCV